MFTMLQHKNSLFYSSVLLSGLTHKYFIKGQNMSKVRSDSICSIIIKAGPKACHLKGQIEKNMAVFMSHQGTKAVTLST